MSGVMNILKWIILFLFLYLFLTFSYDIYIYIAILFWNDFKFIENLQKQYEN